MPKEIKKSFPSDTSMDIKTFLNDNYVDAELYAFLLSISKGEKEIDKEGKKKGKTYVLLEDIPSQKKLAEILNYKSRQTIASHMKYLENNHYLQKEKDRYIILNPEDYFFQIPLDTLQYLLDTVKEMTIKVYIYLGTRYQQSNNYLFTLKELCNQLSICYEKTQNRNRIKNILDLLKEIKLINYTIIYQNNMPYYKLLSFSLHKKVC